MGVGVTCSVVWMTLIKTTWSINQSISKMKGLDRAPSWLPPDKTFRSFQWCTATIRSSFFSLGYSIYPPHSISSFYFSGEIIYSLGLFLLCVHFGPPCLSVFLIHLLLIHVVLVDYISVHHKQQDWSKILQHPGSGAGFTVLLFVKRHPVKL